MKHMKRIVSIVLALTMVLAMGIGAFAADAGDTTPTTPKKVSMTFEGGKKGHTYTAYQILKGDATAANPTTNNSWEQSYGSLENIQWGADAPASLKSQYATAAAAAKAIADQNDARVFAQSLTLTTGGTKVVMDKDGNVEFKDLDPGYYVILDTITGEVADEGDYSSAIMVKVAGDVTGKIKGDAPESDKKVADTNDTTKVQIDLSQLSNTDPAWEDSADYDIGDAVPFRLHATTASNVAAYKKYHVTFQDDQCEGLQMPTEWKVFVLGKEFTVTAAANPEPQTTDKGTKITVEKVDPKSGNDFAIKVTFEPSEDDVIYLDTECNSTDIYVKYESVLSGDGVKIGKDGNPNVSYIEYSNNPEDEDDDEEGRTPDDKVIVFTYKIDVDKVDETGAELKGADFTLYKEVAKDTEGAVTGKAIKDAMTDAKIKEKASALKDDKYYCVVGNKTGTSAGATFDFKGIDDGTYVLVETTVPTGFNGWQSVEVVVTATHDANAADPKLLTLTASAPFTASKDGGDIVEKKNETEKELESGQLYTEIVNNSGAELPETGGIGTTIFYVVGAMLAIGAAVVLVTKKRVNG